MDKGWMLLVACSLLCLHLSDGSWARQAIARNRSHRPGSSGFRRDYGRSQGERRMGGMGFGKRSPDYYGPGEQSDYDENFEEDAAMEDLENLESMEELAGILQQHEEEQAEATNINEAKRNLASTRSFASKRGIAHMARLANEAAEKRGMAHMARMASNQMEKRGIAHMARVAHEAREEEKRGMAHMARMASNEMQDAEEKRGIAHMARVAHEAREEEKRGMAHMARMASNEVHDTEGKRGALASLRSQGFTN